MIKNRIQNQKRNWSLSASTSIPLLLIIVYILLIYSNTFNNSFVFDDEPGILKNENIRSFERFFNSENLAINKRPLTFFSFAFNYSLHKYNPTGYHTLNIILHIIFVLITYFVFQNIFRIKITEKRKVTLLSLSASLIIASHPIQVMAVSYISQRATLLVSLFYILSVYFYMQARKMQISQSPKSIVIFLYFLTAFSGFLALLSKQNAISLLIMLWFVEFFFFRSKNKCFSHKLLSVWGAILIFGFVIITIAGYLPRESENITRWQYLFSQFKVYLQYFQLIIYPSGFNIDHGIELSNSIWGVYELSGLLLILLLLFIAAYLYNKKNAIISFGIIWFFVSMLVESSIIPITDLMFEHRLYLPLVGLVLSLSATLFFILKQNIRIFGLLIMAIVILLGFITYERNNDWKNNKTIWQSSLEENPDNKRALVYVGNAYMHSKPDKALKYYNRALQIDSAYYFAWMNRGMIYYNKKDFSKAASSFDQALKMPGRKHPVLYLKKGISELQLDKLKVSLHDFNRYIAAVPGNAEAYIYRGQVHYYLGDYMESAQDFKTAVSLDPSRSNLYLNIIETYYRAKRPDLVEKYVTIARKNHLKVKQHYLNYVDSQ